LIKSQNMSASGNRLDYCSARNLNTWRQQAKYKDALKKNLAKSYGKQGALI